MDVKKDISIYWAAGCGGCEISVLGIDEKLIDFQDHFNLVFCPCLVDTKKNDLKNMPDNSIFITLFNGAIRTESDIEMAKLLRQKSQLMVAFGACASGGGVVSLGNFYSKEEMMNSIYLDSNTVDNPNGILPQVQSEAEDGILNIPGMTKTVEVLNSVVEVDYYMPGCPPESHQIWNVLEHFINGEELPPKGSIIGAGKKSVCDECKKNKTDKCISSIKRVYEVIPEENKCLLEEGIICMGIATRDGCGALCPEVNMPCIGCYGPPEGIYDQGAKMVAALGSIIDVKGIKGIDDKEMVGKIEDIVGVVPDYAGLFYKFYLNKSLLKTDKS